MTAVVHPGDSLSGRQRFVYVLVLGALTALGPFTIDLYLPSLPDVQRDFGVGTSLVQLTLSATTIGFALGQLLVGPWSDAVGRRVPLIAATGMHVVASILVAVSPSIEWLIAVPRAPGFRGRGGRRCCRRHRARPVRRLSAGADAVAACARIGARARHRAARRFGAAARVPVARDLLGARGLRPARGRRSDRLHRRDAARPSSKDREGRGSGSATAPCSRTASSWESPSSAGMVFTGLFAYLTTSPFLFQDHYHFTAQQYGLLFAVNSVGVIIGVQTSSRIARHVGPQWILAWRGCVLLLTAAVIVVDALLGRRAVGHPDPALVLHHVVRVLFPVPPGARPRPPRRRSGHRGIGARCGELRHRRAHFAADRTVRRVATRSRWA